MPSATTAAPSAWPYPFWIAHRGAGLLAPENTLAAFRHGASYGYRMFECDAKLSADGVLYLMHDAQLDRTTNAQGDAAHWCWAQLAQLDAGSWHGRRWAGEPLPTLAALMRWCIANHFALNIEIKPIPGAEEATGAAVARLVQTLWPADLPPPLLSSFQPAALRAAQQINAQQMRALLLAQWQEDALPTAQALGCAALVCQHTLWDPQRLAATHAQGMRALSYTVNDLAQAQALQAMGTDGIITDRVDAFSPAAQPPAAAR